MRVTLIGFFCFQENGFRWFFGLSGSKFLPLSIFITIETGQGGDALGKLPAGTEKAAV